MRLIDRVEFSSVFAAWSKAIGSVLRGAPMPGEEPRVPGSGLPGDGGPWALVGIKRRGAVLARRLWNELRGGVDPLLYGEVDISLYRDDYHIQSAKPQVLGTEIDFAVDGANILLVDDVLYTGRTVRAAMDLILDFGRPRLVALAVFVDRGHRELPIAPDFVGRRVRTAREDVVRVRLGELSEEDGVELIASGSGT